MPHSNSNHWFVKLFYRSMVAIFTLAILSFVFRLGLTLWLSVSAVVVTLLALFTKIWSDNRHLRMPYPAVCSLFATALFLWLPFGLLLVPGVLVARYLDHQMERGVGWVDRQAADQIKYIEETNERIIYESDWHWYNPFSWGHVVPRTIRETTVRQAIQKASLSTRVFFGFLYALLRCLQYLYYTGLALVLVRSFGYVLARAAVRRGRGFDFSLPLRH